MSTRYDCRDPQSRVAGVDAAVAAARAGELIVLPTDTVYGIGADAFIPAAVTTMLAAKGRGRNMPPPVLVGTARAAAALVEDLGAFGQDLIDEFWPGALTLVFRVSPTLLWDLGDTRGTVALRMPLHAVALDVLKQTGPLAVSSANRTGQPRRDHGRRGAAAARRGGLGLSRQRAVSRQRPVDHPRPDRHHPHAAAGRGDLGGPAAHRGVGHRRQRAARHRHRGLQARRAAPAGGRRGPRRRAGRRAALGQLAGGIKWR